MKPLSMLAIALSLVMLGCGPPAGAPVYRLADLSPSTSLDGPTWIAFVAGDEVPLHLDVDGALFSVRPDKPLTVTVKKSFFLLIGDGRPRVSFDRETFAPGGGSFGFQLGNSKERGPHAAVTVRMHTEGDADR